VTELIGFGVNGTTGDYIARCRRHLDRKTASLPIPVEEITIAGNLLAMYAGIEVIGNDLTIATRCARTTISWPR